MEAITQAKHFIYIENQFFSKSIWDCVLPTISHEYDS